MKTTAAIITTILGIGMISPGLLQSMTGGGAQHRHEAVRHAGQTRPAESAGGGKGYSIITSGGTQEATITIRDGYEPDVLVVKRGIPLKLTIDLKEQGCTGIVVMKEFGIRKTFTAGQPGSREFTPVRAGTYTFACPMHKLEGTLIVND